MRLEPREVHTSGGNLGAGEAFKGLEEECIGQPMKAVPADTTRVVRGGNRQAPDNIGQVGVKRRVETDDLRDGRSVTAQRLDERDFIREVVRSERNQLSQCVKDGGRDTLRIAIVRSAVDDPMTDRCERHMARLAVHPLEQVRHGRESTTVKRFPRQRLWLAFEGEQRRFEAR